MTDTPSSVPATTPYPEIDVSTPHAARMWNYWMGGKDNYAADRAACDAVTAVYPAIKVMAAQSRQFLIRAVTYLAREAGMSQFLDIGTGLPTMQNTHEIAQSINPESRIVYVDNDPMVLAHARALLTNTTPAGVTAYVNADFHDPDQIISDARNVLDLTRPVAVMFMGVLGYAADLDVLTSIVSRVMDAVPSGSHLVLWDGTPTSDSTDAGIAAGEEANAPRYYMRTPEELLQAFAGLELVEPGMVPITQWRPNATDIGDPVWVDAYGAIGRKP
jgi:hypothetical protein